MSDELAKFSKLFSALDEAARKKLLAASSRRNHTKGTVICREGEPGGEFYVVVKGSVVVSGADLLGRSFDLATLGPGEFFGEMAALTGQRRQASVTAQSDVELMAFPPAAVTEVVKASPAALEVMHKAGLQRTEDTMKKMME